MRHRAKHRQLSRTAEHRRALLSNMATSLFRHGRIVTTVAKAKELRPVAEKLITLARRGDLHARRLLLHGGYPPENFNLHHQGVADRFCWPVHR